MPILKKASKSDYSIIPNRLSQDEDLTYEAKGLLIELLSRPNNWTIYKNQLVRPHTKETKLTRIFKELQDAGYMYIQTTRNEDNSKIDNRVWWVSDVSLSMENFQLQASLLNTMFPYVKETLSKENLVLQSKDVIQDKDKKNNTSERKSSVLTTPTSCKDKNNKVWITGDDEYDLSELLLQLILTRQPKRFVHKGIDRLKKGPAYEKLVQNFCLDMDYILRLDKRDPFEVADIIMWCQEDSFWTKNILSANKLRAQYTQLLDNRYVGKGEGATTKDLNPELTTQLKGSYLRRILGNSDIELSSEDDQKIISAANRAHICSQEWKIKGSELVKYLIKCLIARYVDYGETVCIGHLSSDHTWNILMPQYLNEIGTQMSNKKKG